MSGLTEFGLEVETVETVRDSMNEAWRGAFGASVDVSDESPDGIIIGIVADVAAQVWEALEMVSSSQDPDMATGAAQDALAAITGTTRLPAKESEVDLLLIGTVGTPVPAGSRAASASTASLWETQADATIAAAALWAAASAYVEADVVANASRIYLCITSGTSANPGPSTTSADFADGGGVHWKYLGEGLGATATAAKSADAGAIIGTAYDLTVIDTPISGWANVVNLLDADLGRPPETSEALRVRREAELGGQGATTGEAVRAELLRVDGVTSVTVFENDTDVTDGDGIPPHSIEAMVENGADQDIFDQIQLSKGIGIGTYGTEVGASDDSQGTSHIIRFTRPEIVLVYIAATLEIDLDTFPVDGEDQVKAAIVAYGDALLAGRDIRARPIGASVIARTDSAGVTTGVAGVLDAPEVLISDAPTPTVETTIPISLRQRARYDTSRIDLTLVAVIP